MSYDSLPQNRSKNNSNLIAEALWGVIAKSAQDCCKDCHLTFEPCKAERIRAIQKTVRAPKHHCM